MKINKKILIAVICLLILGVGIAVISGLSDDDTEKSENNDSAQTETETSEEGESVILDRDDVKDDGKQEQIEITEKEDASYEEWLAAGAVTAFSLYYPDFEFEEILFVSETELNVRRESKGVYICFVTGGEKVVIHSKPLDKERTKAGTVDLYSQDLGFATFDTVDAGGIKDGDYESIGVKQLDTLISQSMLVSLYEHY